jgi:hypothetical protein
MVGKGRFELAFGLGVIVVGGALTWSVAHYRQFQAYWYSQRFATAKKQDCRAYLHKLVDLGPTANAALSGFVVLPRELRCEELKEKWPGGLSVSRLWIRNHFSYRVCLVIPVAKDDEIAFKSNQALWMTQVDAAANSYILDPGEAVRMAIEPYGACSGGIHDNPEDGNDEAQSTEGAVTTSRHFAASARP